MAAKAPKLKKGEWRTKDGEVLKIRDMGTRHIENALDLLDRQVASYKEKAQAQASVARLAIKDELSTEDGIDLEDLMMDPAEWHVEHVASLPIEQLRPASYRDLAAELRRRQALEARMLDGMKRWVDKNEGGK